LGGAAPAPADVPPGGTVPGYHGDPARSGNYVVPGLSWEAVPGVRRDRGFDGRVEGHVYAQPLYWRPPGAAHGLVIVATESDVVQALDAVSGRTVWQAKLGEPVPGSALPCGNIDPLGITGTPVIDPAAGAIFLDAMVDRGGVPEHLLFGLRLRDGAVLPGWPIDVREALRGQSIAFSPREQNQRAALALLNGRVFVAFGGHYGDCGRYHGIVLGVAAAPARPVAGWETRGLKGGIWAPGGISVAGASLFFTTGNTENAQHWADGEGVFRLGPDLAHTSDPRDFFAPGNWKSLDEDDLDMSGVGPLPIDLSDGSRRVLALGKDGKAYLLDRENLGGVGGQIAIARAAGTAIITGPAFYPVAGRVFVTYQARRAACPDGRMGGGLAAIAVSASSLAPAWCAPLDGRGAPIVTTTDGRSDPTVWVAGAEGDDRLHAFRGDTGQPLYTSPERLDGLRHFVTMLVAEGRLYLAGDGRVAAFSPASR
jgi:outer membrane protein assembly factor BamB